MNEDIRDAVNFYLGVFIASLIGGGLWLPCSMLLASPGISSTSRTQAVLTVKCIYS